MQGSHLPLPPTITDAPREGALSLPVKKHCYSELILKLWLWIFSKMYLFLQRGCGADFTHPKFEIFVWHAAHLETLIFA